MMSKNRLANASSPYLQQHANNPVDWYEWGEEALQKAKREHKPLLISIGYSACHWCHVMEHESYMDEDVAELMNAYFVPIKVDREERPDIDQIYIEAAQLLNGNAGWPLNVFALPDGRPFFAGLYFRKQQWKNVLKQLHKVYQNDFKTVREQAEALTEGVQREVLLELEPQKSSAWSATDYKAIFDGWASKIDLEKGGFQSAQKFPMPSAWAFVLQYAALTKNESALAAVETSLTAMAYGGIYDQLGGGFARYTVDEEWFAPHFEKMLYDNAQLVSLYAQAYRYTKKTLYRRIVEETLSFAERELEDKCGGFWSALNADSEGEEGKFYVWTTAEIDAVLSPDEAHLIMAYFHCTPEGNWENGQNIFYRNQALNAYADQHKQPLAEVRDRLTTAKHKLMTARNRRVRPSTDDKILLSWNAMLITAYVDAYKAFTVEKQLKKAEQIAEFVENNMHTDDGRLWRSFKDGKPTIHAFLDDYAFLANAYTALYEVTFTKDWLDKAKALTDEVIAHFYDPETALFYYTSDQAEQLIARKKELTDNVIPSSNAVMAEVCQRLATYFQADKYATIAQKMLQNMSLKTLSSGPYFGQWAQVLGQEVYSPFEVAITGEQAKMKAQEVQQTYIPNALFLGGEIEDLPLLQHKLSTDETLIYVCRDKICQQPVTTAKAALQVLNK